MIPKLCSRRHFLHTGAFSLKSLALASLLRQDGLLAAPVKPHGTGISFDTAPKAPAAAGKAQAMISLFMIGGPSQMDLFDPKPMLNKYDQQKFPGEIKYDNAAEASSKVLGSPFKFQKHGQCGMEISELLPHLGSIADEVCLIRSMQTGVNNHGQSLFALNSGGIQSGRPVLGSWLNYGLGSANQELPAFVALTSPHGPPLLMNENWSNGWLPSIYQGTPVRYQHPHILNLDPPKRLEGTGQRRQLDYLRRLNEEHLEMHPEEPDLAARISSYELAASMQTEAKEALNFESEPEHIRKMYGVDQDHTRDYGIRCLVARRLVERGVRFVQVWNQGQSWDHHGAIFRELPNRCREVDQPCAALVKDLRQRGLLDTTVVHWGGEMGRLPVLQNDGGKDKWGRDHNTYGFSMWMAGGGFKGGLVHGETDEWGHHAVKDIVTHSDYHATLLHLFGLDHAKLTYQRNGTALSLTNGSKAKVVEQLLA